MSLELIKVGDKVVPLVKGIASDAVDYLALLAGQYGEYFTKEEVAK